MFPPTLSNIEVEGCGLQVLLSLDGVQNEEKDLQAWGGEIIIMSMDNFVCACVCPQEGFRNFIAEPLISLVTVHSCVHNTLCKHYHILCGFYK